MKANMKKIILISVLLIVIDQFIKYIISENMVLFQSVEIIKDFFSLTYLINDGAAFSILSGNIFLLVIITVLVMGIIYYYFIKEKILSFKEIFIYGILYGGIIGNLIDRVFKGGVIDYLDFRILNYDFPVFNFADICIVISIALLAIITLRGEKYEDSNK